eukprot:2773942-Prymnesium_polylepis.1
MHRCQRDWGGEVMRVGVSEADVWDGPAAKEHGSRRWFGCASDPLTAVCGGRRRFPPFCGPHGQPLSHIRISYLVQLYVRWMRIVIVHDVRS